MAYRTSSSEDPQLNRRQLLGGSLMLAGLPPCCSTEELPTASVIHQERSIIIDLERAIGLHRIGSARAIVDRTRKLNIIVVHVESDRFVALDRSCTHNGAQCAYDAKRRTLQCTSLNHAEYDLDGSLLHGRTHGNLRSYEVRRHGARLEVLLRNAA